VHDNGMMHLCRDRVGYTDSSGGCNGIMVSEGKS
jgi:hypothetical protein